MLPGGTPANLVCLLEFAGERVAIWAGRAALDVTIVQLPGAVGGEMPRGIIGHRTLDAEQASVEIGDDQEEGVAGVVGVGHGPCSIAQFLRMIKDVIIVHQRPLHVASTGCRPCSKADRQKYEILHRRRSGTCFSAWNFDPLSWGIGVQN